MNEPHPVAEYLPVTHRFTIYEPRWHGWARWELSYSQPLSDYTHHLTPIESGWTRRPRGSSYITVDGLDLEYHKKLMGAA